MMRLICPNCGAQYEVADDVIPAGGRDVQCSNCSHTWFENPGASAAAEDEIEQEIAGSDVVANESMTVTDDDMSDDAETPDAARLPATPESHEEDETPVEQDLPAAKKAAFSGSITDAFADLDTDETPPVLPDTVTDFESAEGEQMPTEAPLRRTVDASIAAILQEEAATEKAARQAAAQVPIEQQDELGLTAPTTQRPAPARADETRRLIRGLAEDDAVEAAAAGSRRELLPDIEEINSSLRSSAERGDMMIDEPDEMAAEKRRGFRFGFVTVLIMLALLVAVYILAPQISAAVPSLKAPLDTYVAGVDAARIWLDVKMQTLLTMIEPAAETEPTN